jgi:hypothetical protein
MIFPPNLEITVLFCIVYFSFYCLSPWILKVIGKFGGLSFGLEANDGQCVVAWSRVTRRKELGGRHPRLVYSGLYLKTEMGMAVVY